MTKDPDSIVEKIRALLRLAKSDNAHEASLAMQRAMEIAAKYQIDLAAISPDDDLNKLIGNEMSLPSRLAYEWKEALTTVHNYFNVNVTVLIGVSSKKAQIIGTALDIEIASYVATFLVRTCRECLAGYRKAETICRRKITTAKVHSFIKGFFWSIRDGLRKQKETVAADHAGYQLMLDNGRAARDQAAKGISQGFGPSSAIEMPDARANRKAALHGFMQGSKTQIRPGLRGGSILELT